MYYISDIEKISRYSNEREVLFFPFSTFEIKDKKKRYIIMKHYMKFNYYI